MHASDDVPFQMALIDLAFARGALGPEADNHFIRGRIAIMAWLPGAMSVVLLATSLRSLALGVAGIALLLTAMWLFTERADQVVAFARRRVSGGS
jgi:hypothetical protein